MASRRAFLCALRSAAVPALPDIDSDGDEKVADVGEDEVEEDGEDSVRLSRRRSWGGDAPSLPPP